ncbi:hypothetical protein [Gloeothece verrucosa]|uniref:Uncharacterized protein n=1 Tax=Gloeothece verrucosa (strain PCC 7822) TaxID=497965 RepID=E0UM82_GLOV7|nr:hypothetical protein [Gloeothece verrucosa]ADN18062.1 hypothetical protein Cyan7822_6262 [Gloeothece verrucosa PCC 7822]
MTTQILAQKESKQPASRHCKDNTTRLSLPTIIEEKASFLAEDQDVAKAIEIISQILPKIGVLFEHLAQLGEAEQILQNKCGAIAAIECKEDYEDFVKADGELHKKSLYHALLQNYFPDSNLFKWLEMGYKIRFWYKSVKSRTAATVIESKLDLLKLGQPIGNYQVGQRNKSEDPDEPIFQKVLESIDDGTIFAQERGNIELDTLEEGQLIEIDQLINATLSTPSTSALEAICEVEEKLRSPEHLPLSYIASFEKLTDEWVKTCPVVRRGTLKLLKWNSIKQKIKVVDLKKLKGECLPIQLEIIKHRDILSKRLGWNETEVDLLLQQVLELAQKKEEESPHTHSWFSRPVGKVMQEYRPLPWISDVEEVLETSKVAGENLDKLRYDLGVFTEEYDWQIVAAKFKLDVDEIASLKKATEELAIENNRPLDPFTGLIRSYKDDLFQAIAISGRDATKLLKKTTIKYSPEEVRELVEEKTGELKQQLEMEQQSREQLETKILSLEERFKQELERERIERQKLEQMMQQILAQQVISVNNNGHQPVVLQES